MTPVTKVQSGPGFKVAALVDGFVRERLTIFQLAAFATFDLYRARHPGEAAS